MIFYRKHAEQLQAKVHRLEYNLEQKNGRISELYSQNSHCRANVEEAVAALGETSEVLLDTRRENALLKAQVEQQAQEIGRLKQLMELPPLSVEFPEYNEEMIGLMAGVDWAAQHVPIILAMEEEPDEDETEKPFPPIDLQKPHRVTLNNAKMSGLIVNGHCSRVVYNADRSVSFEEANITVQKEGAPLLKEKEEPKETEHGKVRQVNQVNNLMQEKLRLSTQLTEADERASRLRDDLVHEKSRTSSLELEKGRLIEGINVLKDKLAGKSAALRRAEAEIKKLHKAMNRLEIQLLNEGI